MTNYCEMIKTYLDEKDRMYKIRENEDYTVFAIPVDAKNTPGMLIDLYIENNGIAKIRCYLCRGVEMEKRTDILRILNELNVTYRYVTFSLDKDMDIAVSYDFNLTGDDITGITFDMLKVCSSIVDEAIPHLAKALWN